MEAIVRVTKDGIYNIVPIGAYNSVYKKKGWVIVEENIENELDCELKGKGIIDENRQNAYIRAKNEKTKRHFDDGLIIGE